MLLRPCRVTVLHLLLFLNKLFFKCFDFLWKWAFDTKKMCFRVGGCSSLCSQKLEMWLSWSPGCGAVPQAGCWALALCVWRGLKCSWDFAGVPRGTCHSAAALSCTAPSRISTSEQKVLDQTVLGLSAVTVKAPCGWRVLLMLESGASVRRVLVCPICWSVQKSEMKSCFVAVTAVLMANRWACWLMLGNLRLFLDGSLTKTDLVLSKGEKLGHKREMMNGSSYKCFSR